jgi:hypothetical protein
MDMVLGIAGGIVYCVIGAFVATVYHDHVSDGDEVVFMGMVWPLAAPLMLGIWLAKKFM